MSRSLLILAFHAYAVGALFYLFYLVRPLRWIAWAARVAGGVGWVTHGVGLLTSPVGVLGLLQGLKPGLSGLGFLLIGLALFLDLRYRAPVLGAFLLPASLIIMSPALVGPGLLGGSGDAPVYSPARLLPLHIAVALMGMAAFGVAAALGGLYLVLEREMRAKRFGLLFSRLPSLQLLDELNGRLMVLGFISLSIAGITGAVVGWAWGLKEIVTVLAWVVFAGVLNARLFAGWRGRRVALITVAGFAALTVVFLSYYLPSLKGGM